MVKQDIYAAGLFWILRERRSSHGGWPPRDVNTVSGWTIVRFLADLTGRSPREVAVDLIDHSKQLDLEDGGV
jgi:hypothetical protein